MPRVPASQQPSWKTSWGPGGVEPLHGSWPSHTAGQQRRQAAGQYRSWGNAVLLTSASVCCAWAHVPAHDIAWKAEPGTARARRASKEICCKRLLAIPASESSGAIPCWGTTASLRARLGGERVAASDMAGAGGEVTAWRRAEKVLLRKGEGIFAPKIDHRASAVRRTRVVRG